MHRISISLPKSTSLIPIRPSMGPTALNWLCGRQHVSGANSQCEPAQGGRRGGVQT